jgi:hypothetical protein
MHTYLPSAKKNSNDADAPGSPGDRPMLWVGEIVGIVAHTRLGCVWRNGWVGGDKIGNSQME